MSILASVLPRLESRTANFIRKLPLSSFIWSPIYLVSMLPISLCQHTHLDGSAALRTRHSDLRRGHRIIGLHEQTISKASKLSSEDTPHRLLDASLIALTCFDRFNDRLLS